jgi:hypothetical protein
LIFQRRSRSQGIRPKFSIGTKYIEYWTHYKYLGEKISSTGYLNERESTPLTNSSWNTYSNVAKTNRICHWTNCTLRQQGTKQDFIKWDKHPIETLYAEFCILHVQRKCMQGRIRPISTNN